MERQHILEMGTKISIIIIITVSGILVIIIFNSLSHLQLLDCAGEDDEPLSTTAPIATNKPIIELHQRVLYHC